MDARYEPERLLKPIDRAEGVAGADASGLCASDALAISRRPREVRPHSVRLAAVAIIKLATSSQPFVH
jgi:hypothetical protein